jgi:hypothetical protein
MNLNHIPGSIKEKLQLASRVRAVLSKTSKCVETTTSFSIEEMLLLQHENCLQDYVDVCLEKVWPTVGALNGNRTATVNAVYETAVASITQALKTALEKYMADLAEYEKQVEPHLDFFRRSLLEIPLTSRLANRIAIRLHVTASSVFFSVEIDGSDTEEYLVFKPVPVFGRVEYF